MIYSSKDKDILGITERSIFNDGIYQIIIKTGVVDDNTSSEEEVPIEVIENALLHELGHNFDDFFGNKNKALEMMYREVISKEDLDEFDIINLRDTRKMIDSTFDLSDTDLFKNAWKNDVELLSKNENNNILTDLKYFSPNRFNDIDISDGISDEECQIADDERAEIFSQLFAFALGSKGSKYHNKELITSSYAECHKVVKSYIQKFLGFKSDDEQKNTVNPAKD